MSSAVKRTLIAALLYLIVIGAVGWWMANQMRGLAHEMAESTAQLVGGEVARALSATALEQLRRGDAETRARLEQIVDDVTDHSAILTSLAVVDRRGEVIAGDNVAEGAQLALPDIVFPDDRRVRVISPQGAGEFYMLVRLQSPGEAMAGYVRLSMRSQRIAAFYGRAIRGLLLVGLAGLVAVAAAGLLLHARLSRRSAALTHALEAAARGETAAPRARRDEFSHVLDVAQQMGQQLSAARGERQHAEQRMGALMKALDVGVLVLEPDLRLGFANRRALELLGSQNPDDLASVWDGEIKPVLSSVLVPGEHAGAGRPVEHELPARAGRPRLKLELYELGEGSCEGYLGLAKSADSIEALEGELGLAMQMRGLTRFYAAFAHDLKAPLNAMVMNLELLKLSAQTDNGMDEATRAKQGKYVGVLNEEIRRLDRQLRTLLSQTAPPSAERRALDLRAVIEDLEALLGAQARRQRVALTTSLPDAPVTIDGVGDRLKQALLNIFINALEAMPDGGELAITLAARDTQARLTVRDSGPGIPAELLRSIYEMHFTTKSGGSGVGLFVARTVVRAHGGSIDVDTSPDRGTTFAIEIPLAPPAA